METILIDERQLNEKYSQDINRLKLALADYSQKLSDALDIDMNKVAHDFIEPQWIEGYSLDSNIRNLINICGCLYGAGIFTLSQQVKNDKSQKIFLR